MPSSPIKFDSSDGHWNYVARWKLIYYVNPIQTVGVGSKGVHIEQSLFIGVFIEQSLLVGVFKRQINL